MARVHNPSKKIKHGDGRQRKAAPRRPRPTAQDRGEPWDGKVSPPRPPWPPIFRLGSVRHASDRSGDVGMEDSRGACAACAVRGVQRRPIDSRAPRSERHSDEAPRGRRFEGREAGRGEPAGEAGLAEWSILSDKFLCLVATPRRRGKALSVNKIRRP